MALISPRDLYLRQHPELAERINSPKRLRRFLNNHPGIASGWQRVMGATQPTLSDPQNPEPGAPPPTPPPGPAQAPAPAPYVDPFSPEERNAYARIRTLFESYGLGSLAPRILEYAQAGYGDDTIDLMLQETPEYKQRFAANDARRRAGLRVLSPGEYLGLEESYRRVLSANGLPAGFYDSTDDFRNWIENDVDPTEINERAQMAAAFVANTDPAVRRAFREFYGIGDSDLVAYALDRNRGLALLQKQANAVTIGGAAGTHGLSISRERAERFADQGRAQIADSAFAQVADVLPDANRLSAIYAGEDYSQTDAEDEFLGGMASAKRKRRKLVEKEVSSFSGRSGVTSQTLGRSTAGSY